MPKNPYCKACQKCSVYKRHARRKKKVKEGEIPLATQFGDSVTFDHFLLRKEDSVGVDGEKACMVGHDEATDLLGAYPQAAKAKADAIRAIKDWAGPVPHKVIKRFYSDNAGEFLAAAKALHLVHEKSTPRRLSLIHI